MTDLQRGTEAGWPFWAPSDDAGAARALALAGVRPGDRVVDLGCGDGRVLVAAALLGADVRGVECDADLAAQAREAIAAAGVVGEVIEADLFTVDLDADIAFCYLSPATLQRLASRLRPGTRLVTVDFEVPGLVPDAVDGPAHLYRTPGVPAPTPVLGWSTEGTLVVAPPDVESLTCLEVVHPGGAVEIEVSASLDGLVSIQTGADVAAPGEVVAVDLVWRPGEAGLAHCGTVRCRGVAPHALIAVREEWGPEGTQWELTADGAADIAAWVANHPAPHTITDLLTAANGE